MKNRILFLLALLLVNFVGAQIPYLSKEAKVSVLTCGPGSELYAKFGHSAIRIKDASNRMDIVYNYGVFDFTQPNFYLNFAKGRLNYMLVRHRTADFINQYKKEGRSIVEQVLHLTREEQQKLLNFLEDNAKPENRTYSYHFFFNNCSTKIIDVIVLANPSINFNEEFVDNNSSFRALIDQNLNKNSWSSLGINIALGSKIDRIATDYEHRFLPEFTKKQIDHSTVKNKALVSKEQHLLEQKFIAESGFSITSPLVLFSLIALLTIVLVYKKVNYNFLKIGLFSTASFIGIGILFLWFFTDHDMTQLNYNILWANPLLLTLIFDKKLSQKAVSILKKLILLSFALIPVVALFDIQSFHYTLYPLILALIILVFKSSFKTTAA